MSVWMCPFLGPEWFEGFPPPPHPPFYESLSVIGGCLVNMNIYLENYGPQEQSVGFLENGCNYFD